MKKKNNIMDKAHEYLIEPHPHAGREPGNPPQPLCQPARLG